MKILNKKRGFGMVESIIAVSIVGSFIVVLAGVNNLYLRVALNNAERMQAYFLAEEGIEAVKSMRDDSWNTNIAPLLSGTPYRLAFESSAWKLYPNILEEEGFTRSVSVEDVYRDGGDNIALSGSSDPNTKLVKVEVSWNSREGLKTIDLEGYITNLFEN